MASSDSPVSLLPFNSFQLDSTADELFFLDCREDVRRMLEEARPPLYIIGGGSNILLAKHLPGTAIINRLGGIEIVAEGETHIAVEVASGEEWHSFVQWAVQRGYGGVENLALIPGTVGAAPIQNIGAYGVEVSSVIEEVQAVDLESGEEVLLKASDCGFGYRTSVFKERDKGRYFILSVRMKLSKGNHTISKGYWALEQWLEEQDIVHPGIADIYEAVVSIRKSKLPDSKVLGNAGSFFKNLEVEEKVFGDLKHRFPDLKYYALPDGRYKIPTGWLIERCGWKGRKLGRCGSHKHQALVLVNYGGASGADIVQLAQRIQDDVRRTFGLEITPEVNIWP